MSFDDLRRKTEEAIGRKIPKRQAEIAAKPKRRDAKEAKKIPTDPVEIWLEGVTEYHKEQFQNFCSVTPSAVEIFLYARLMGYDGEITDMDRWSNKNYPKRDWRGVLADQIESMVTDMDNLRYACENGNLKIADMIRQEAALARELRGSIEQMTKWIANVDRRATLLAGADRAIREINAMFKDAGGAEGLLAEIGEAVFDKIVQEEAYK